MCTICQLIENLNETLVSNENKNGLLKYIE